MAADVLDLKAGKTVSKPIYNHITGELDPYEEVSPTPIVIFEGLHPMYDDRVRGALDLSVYLDITDDVKFAWKAQRDIAERGATMEEVQAAIDARKPDFAAYVEPQKAKADIIVQVLLSDLIDDPTGKFLKVKLIQKDSVYVVKPAYFFDEGSSIEWTPNPEKLTTSAPGVKIKSLRGRVVRPAGLGHRDGRQDRQPRGGRLRRVAPLQLGHQVLRRALGADRQEQGLARLGQRHRPLPDRLRVQDSRGVRGDLQVNYSHFFHDGAGRRVFCCEF